jgi:hypothetical protein
METLLHQKKKKVVCSVSKWNRWAGKFFDDAMTAEHYLLVEKSFKSTAPKISFLGQKMISFGTVKAT